MIDLRNSKKTILYILMSYGTTLLNVALNILLIRMFTSAQLGRVSLGKSIFQSFEFSHIGIRFGLDRILPHCKGENERNVIFTTAFLFSVISSLVFCLFWFLYDIANILLYFPFIISGLLYTFVTLYKIYYRAFENKNTFLYISFWIIFFPNLLQLLGLLLFDFYGYIVAHLVSYMFAWTIAYYYFNIRFVFNKTDVFRICKLLFSKGYLLFFSTLVSYLATTGDRFLIEKYWGIELLGVYSVVMFFFSALTLFANSYTEMIMSKIILLKSFRFILKHMIFIIIFSVCIVVLAYLLVPYFIQWFIPQYVQYISLVRLVLLGTLPFSVLPILNYYLHAIDKRIFQLFINIICTYPLAELI